MWILLYIFSFNVMPSTQTPSGEWKMTPIVVMQEFSSQATCNTVKDTITSTLKDSASFARSALDDLRSAGVTGNNVSVVFSVECFPK
jgi:hypothetical protein